MRLQQPRIAPLSDDEMSADQREMLGERFKTGKVFNIFRTLSKAPKAYKAFMRWGGYILSDHNDLSPRDRELVILRAGFNWKSGYEWAQHVRIGLDLTVGQYTQVSMMLNSFGIQLDDDLTLDPDLAK